MTDPINKPARKQVTLAELEPLIRNAFAEGKGFWLPVTGTSNLPTLSGGRDEIILGRVDRPLKKRDLPLYRRDSGQYVLHRVVSVQRDGTFTCCGDNQWTREPGIRPDQVIGKVIRITRKGKTFSPENLLYRTWVWLWVLLLPCRRILIRGAHYCNRVRRKLFSRK